MKVLITRPEHQAKNLLTAVNALGYQAYHFPTIYISSIKDNLSLVNAIKLLPQSNMLIFVSRNAVNYSLPIIKACYKEIPKKLTIATIGTSTQQALTQYQLTVDICPQGQFTSEALLALTPLQDVQDKQIIIFKGVGGRTLLIDTLQQRGAEVVEAVVYQRTIPELKQQLPQVDNFACALFTSGTALNYFCQMIGSELSTWRQQVPLLVSSERLKQNARALGFSNHIYLAENASDKAMTEALKKIQ